MVPKIVLVVDDSVTIRKIICKELELSGYTVVTAANGAEALVRLEQMSILPDLITLDIDMPVMGGFEVCEMLRQVHGSDAGRYRRAAGIPILFVSANDSLENRKRGHRLEVIDFISKPFAKGEISKVVDRVLSPVEMFTGMRALVVEDSPVIRKLVASALERNGVEVTVVEDGQEALRLVEQDDEIFDIVITDYKMPRIRGDELCRRLLTIEKMAQVPIFFISSSDEKDVVLDFFKAGASDYLKKPFILEELQARVVTHLRARKYVIELNELNEKLRVQATRDSLTGLYNRRYFQEVMTRNFARAVRYGKEFSCLLIDLDFFKKVNDTQGHAFGDLVLREFSGLLQQRIREADVAARYGGEEFILILSDTDLKGAETLAEGIRGLAEQYVYTDAGKKLRVTCSIGVSSLRSSEPDTAERMISMADDALYAAKEMGRNRVEVFSRRPGTVRHVKMGGDYDREN
jgi:diguanylate cyclase (GGDEF)-like protein